jgi:K+-transporting ATPase ATPase C chain
VTHHPALSERPTAGSPTTIEPLESLERKDADPDVVPSLGATRRTVTTQLVVAVRVALVALVLCGLLYPLAVLAVGRTAFGDAADGSLVRQGSTIVGSSLLAQRFTEPRYFHPRPSAAGDGYDGLASAGSNLGPSNPDLAAVVAERTAAYRDENGLADTDPVPVDAVTTSGSGLDPEISPRNADLQVRRVAEARGLPVDLVQSLADMHLTGRQFGFLGEPGVNVLDLNLALDALSDQ